MAVSEWPEDRQTVEAMILMMRLEKRIFDQKRIESNTMVDPKHRQVQISRRPWLAAQMLLLLLVWQPLLLVFLATTAVELKADNWKY